MQNQSKRREANCWSFSSFGLEGDIFNLHTLVSDHLIQRRTCVRVNGLLHSMPRTRRKMLFFLPFFELLERKISSSVSTSAPLKSQVPLVIFHIKCNYSLYMNLISHTSREMTFHPCMLVPYVIWSSTKVVPEPFYYQVQI